MPDTLITTNGKYEWSNNGRNMELIPFYDHTFSYGEFNGWGSTPSSEDKFWLIIKTENTTEWSTLLTVIKLYPEAYVSKISDGKVQINNKRIFINIR